MVFRFSGFRFQVSGFRFQVSGLIHGGNAIFRDFETPSFYRNEIYGFFLFYVIENSRPQQAHAISVVFAIVTGFSHCNSLYCSFHGLVLMFRFQVSGFRFQVSGIGIYLRDSERLPLPL